MKIYVPGKGNPSAKILIIGEAPMYEDEKAGAPFMGAGGKVLDECLRNARINRGDCWTTNVFKEMIMPQTKSGKKIPAFVRAQQAGIDVQKSIQELRYEIDQIKPNVIVPMGGTALWALFGKDKISVYRGSILPSWNYKIVPTYSPASILHGDEGRGNYWQKVIIEFDLRRAKQQSTFPEIIRPPRNLIVCRNSAQLQEFYDRGKERSKKLGRPIKLAIDIEAIHCIPVCISFSWDKTEGMCVPLWNTTPIVKISNIPTSDLASMWFIMNRMMQDSCFLPIGQNFKYDEDKIRRLGFRIGRLHSDTMLKAFAINPELSVGLAFNTSIYTEEPYYKDEGLEFDYTKHPIDDLFLYGAKDAPITLEIDDCMESDLIELGQEKFYYNFLMKLHYLYMDVENQGMRIIEENRTELLKKYIAWSEQLTYDLWKLTGTVINVKSPKQVAILLYDVLKIPTREGTGEEVLTQLLGNTVKKESQRQVISNILTQRRIDKTLGTYLMAMADYDKRMRTSYFICLETGRTSTSLLEPPIRPKHDIRDDEGKKKKKYIGVGFQVITKHGDVGGDVRKMYGPDIGELFINIDSSQAEARVIALLSNDMKMLAMYDTNDVHALTASWFLGGTEEQYSKKSLGYECPERFLGKTLRHAGHLGAKKHRAMLEVNTQARKYNINISVTEQFCDLALKTFHRKSPAIQGVFHKEVIEALTKTKRLTAPLPYGIDAKKGGVRTFYERYGDDLFRQAFSYIPQRAVSDNTKAAALRIRDRIPGIKLAVESHDSLLFSIPIGAEFEYAPILKEEMERPIDFSNCSLPRKSLIIPADIEIGYDYKDLEKFRMAKIV